MRTLRFPHPLLLLVGGVLLAAVLTWLLPSGEYARQHDPTTDRDVVVAGTYHAVPRQPVGPFAALVAIPQGMIEAADVIFFVFLVGGAFSVVERTGALTRGVNGLVTALGRRETLVIPVVSLAFAAGGALEHMQEEHRARPRAAAAHSTSRLGCRRRLCDEHWIGGDCGGVQSYRPISGWDRAEARAL